jgi:transketolase N-terminal domain/subunit
VDQLCEEPFVTGIDLTSTQTLSQQDLELIDAYWRAANYLSVGQIYLLDNPLLREPLQAAHIKPRLLGHWGTTPGLNLLYAHMNRVIKQRDLNALYVTGPGHGGPGLVANAYLEGTYSEIYSRIGQDLDGLRALFRQFSFPGGIPSHVAPETPGSIHEGGELGYALVHAYGAAFDNPDLLVLCVVGDGEAETGPLAASWHSNKFLNPVRDGAVLPVLHLNGYKIASPTVLARIGDDELTELMRGYGYDPHYVVGDDPAAVHRQLAATLDEVCDRVAAIQQQARSGDAADRPTWPMIVLRTPKGWTGPKEVDGVPVEGTFRSHQVPLDQTRSNAQHRTLLEQWLRSYRPEELFDDTGALIPALRALAPSGGRRMSANPHANGGLLLRELTMPDFRDYAVPVDRPAVELSEATQVLGVFLRDITARNRDRFRIMGPDETASNRLTAVFEVTDRAWDAARLPGDDHLGPDGRVMEVLSEHLCQGWLEGYLLTGRHGLFNCYEAFIHIVDSMLNQHAKWLKTTRTIPWRRPIASLNYLLSSHVWRQDHNGFSHQDPGFIDHPAPAATYAVPQQWQQRYNIRRYGFHGLSHAYCSQRAAQLLDQPVQHLRIVTCHLGAGASLAAVVSGHSVDTTMGFTPLEGLVMATRSGTVDPGLVLWLEEHEHLSPREVATALEHRSGLTALAGTGDMRMVQTRADSGDSAAALALDVYLHRLVTGIGAMTAAAGGVDVLVFTGGVGEHSPAVRARAVQRLAHLGAGIDTRLNDTTYRDGDITAAGATVRTVVVTAREDLQMAREARWVLTTRPRA